MKVVLIALALVLLGGSSLQAQQPVPPAPGPAKVTYGWKIVLFNFLNQRRGVLPGTYPDKDSCQLALDGLGYSNIDVLGNHGKCSLIPLLGKKHPRPHAVVRAKG